MTRTDGPEHAGDTAIRGASASGRPPSSDRTPTEGTVWRDAGSRDDSRRPTGRAVPARPTGREEGRDRSANRNDGRSDRRAAGLTGGAICVQRLDDSLNSAIHTRYRSSRRSSSMHEPRGPPLKVVVYTLSLRCRAARRTDRVYRVHTRHRAPAGRRAVVQGEGARGGTPLAVREEDSGFDGLLSPREDGPSPTPSRPRDPLGAGSRGGNGARESPPPGGREQHR